MRVIAGKFRSRRLRPVGGLKLRPTSDRLRETLFDILTAGNPLALEGSVWIDLFAGTGAIGIEALSRGAAMVYFVESSKGPAELIAQNLRYLDIQAGFELLREESQRALRALEQRRIQPDFIFLDPPYQLRSSYREILRALSGSWLSQRALVMAEHEKRFDPGEKVGMLERCRRVEQGDAALTFYRRGAELTDG
jgi:16S rRNA (guanine966-N2)-methyltransferase